MIEQFSRQTPLTRSTRHTGQERLVYARDTVGKLLLEGQDEQGGWPAVPGFPITTESTALGLLALSFASGERSAAGANRARAWLRSRQRPDGAWPHSDQVAQSDWATSLAIVALSRFPEERSSTDAAAEWLLGQEGRRSGWLTKLMFLLFPERKVIRLDLDLIGWPWYPNTFSWVEPTSYSLIAVKSLRPDLKGRHARDRIDEAERMILDRVCMGGGWNYGNSKVLGEELWPYPDTTALALIALQDFPRPESLEQSLAALREMVEDRASVLSLALAVLALQLHGRDVSAVRSRLVERFEGERRPADTRSLAFAALAMADGAMPLAVPPDSLRAGQENR
ncbi:MAG: prenyltransferase/squalene oxidase repeat-containing protein [Gemmatimonadales bacterium]